MWLLDVNVLLAIAWPRHPDHPRAIPWFAQHSREGIRTCAITQMGFVRISSTAVVPGMAATVEEAGAQLEQLTALPVHEFWNCPLSWADVWHAHGPLRGNKQVTDAYLLALANAHGGRLVTFDRGVTGLRGAEGVVELLA